MQKVLKCGCKDTNIFRQNNFFDKFRCILYSCKSTESKILSAKSDCNFFFAVNCIFKKKTDVWVHSNPFFPPKTSVTKKTAIGCAKDANGRVLFFAPI